MDIKKNIGILILLLASFCAASPARAATLEVSADPAHPGVGEEFTLEVRITSQDDSINAAEGALILPSQFDVIGVTSGGSAFSLWPVAPVFVRGSNAVEFTGGTTSSSPLSHALLFTIRAKATAVGTYTLTLKNARAFLADGKGTPATLILQPVKVPVANSSAVTEAKEQKDTTAPVFVSAEVGSDPSLFGGKQYISLFATDEQSGVQKFEVKEGFFGSYVPVDRYYVLKDQERGSDVWVRATDNAGNSVTEKIPALHPSYTGVLIAGGILVAAALLVLVRFIKKPR